MLAAAAIAMGLALGLLSGGRLLNLKTAVIPHEGFVLILFLAQAAARSSLGARLGLAALLFWGASSLVLFVICLRAADLPGFGVVAAGIGCNAVVILLNGYMPVVPPANLSAAATDAVQLSAGFYKIADSSTLLPKLGDVLPAAIGLASLGDLLLAVGVCVFVAHWMQEGTEA